MPHKNLKSLIPVFSVNSTQSFLDFVDGWIRHSVKDHRDALKELSVILRAEMKLDATEYEIEQSITYLHVFLELFVRFYPNTSQMFLVKDLSSFFERIICNDEIKTTKLIKYYYIVASSIAYNSARFPDKPQGAKKNNNKFFPFGGAFYKAVFRRMKKGDRKAITFASSLTLCRYAAIEVPEEFINASEISYVNRLTKIPVLKQYDLNSISQSVGQIRKSSFEKYLKNLAQCVTTRSSSDEGVFGQYSTINVHGPQISYKNVRDQEYQGVCPAPYFAYNFMPKELTGNVTHLTEPLKVRSITTSNAFEFFAGKPFQATISSEMKKMKNLCFGRMVEEPDVIDLIHRSKQYFGTDEELIFLSGDYEAATDNINPMLSAIVDEYMMKHMNLDFELPELTFEESKSVWKIMSQIYEYCLVDKEADLGPKTSEKYWISINLIFKHFLPKSCLTVLDKRRTSWAGRTIKNKANEMSCVQTFGQMMGDIKSFPVLCLINLSLWNLVNENKTVSVHTQRTCPLTDSIYIEVEKISPPCLINGDDFLAYCPRTVIEKWFEKVTEFDLVASIGKTHESPNVAQINSTNFMYNKNTNIVKKVKAIPFHAVIRIPQDRPIEQSINYAIEHDVKLLNRVIFFNKKRINDVTQNGLINLCIPRELGGIGVKAVPKEITAKQSILASVNIRKLNNGKDPVALQYDWLPFLSKKKRVKNVNIQPEGNGLQTFVYTRKPKGKGEITDQFGINHLLPTYSSTRESRMFCRDDPIGKMSRQEYGTRGIMRIRNNFYGKVQKIVNTVLKQAEVNNDQRNKKLKVDDLVVPPATPVRTKKGLIIKSNVHPYIQSTTERLIPVTGDLSWVEGEKPKNRILPSYFYTFLKGNKESGSFGTYYQEASKLSDHEGLFYFLLKDDFVWD